MDDGVDDKMAAASQSSSQWDEAFHEPVKAPQTSQAYPHAIRHHSRSTESHSKHC